MSSQTCSGITIMKIFLSFSDKMGLMKVHPVPTRTMVMNNTAPFNLQLANFV